MKLKTTKGLKKKCDLLWSTLVKKVGRCERCDKSSGVQLQSAHIFSRRYSHIRHDLSNGVCLDASCHFWAHSNPVEFSRGVVKYLGEDLIHKLEIKKQLTSKVNYEEVYNDLKNKTL